MDTPNKLVSPLFGYRPSLDGLRACAVMAVMVSHAGLGIGRFRLLPGGREGVDVFFALSGFLITTILLKEYDANGKIQLKNFYARRALRLIPALVALLVVFNIYTTLFETRDLALQSYWFSISALFYVSNWLRVFTYGHPALGHLWSLSIEEQFYILSPTLLILLLKLNLKRWHIAALILPIVVASPLYRLYLWNGHGSLGHIYNGLDTRVETLFIGCALALIRYDKLPARLVHAIGIVSGAFLILNSVFVLEDAIEMTLGISLVGYASVGLVAAAMRNPGSAAVRFLEWRPVVWTGKLSYSLYLWHLPVYYVIGFSPLWHAKAFPLMAIVLTFPLATASYYLVEQPCLKLKKLYAAKRMRSRVVQVITDQNTAMS